MKICSAELYEGDAPYIFISYSRKDKRYVYPVIESLAREGFRVWYDEGIKPGTEWKETIAEHLAHSGLCLAFISQNSMDSHNCKEEINYVKSKKCQILPVFLGKAELSAGMEMTLSQFQWIIAATYPNIGEFSRMMKNASALKPFLGEHNDAVEIHQPDFFGEITENNVVDITDAWYAAEPVPAVNEYILIRQSSNEKIPVTDGYLHIGREAESGKNSYIIFNNPTIGRTHCSVTEKDGVYLVTDNNSKNGTFLNVSADDENRLKPCEPNKLSDGDMIRVSKGISAETFIFTRENGGAENEN